MSARRPYVRPMAGWWRRNPWFVEYMVHEATALAVVLARNGVQTMGRPSFDHAAMTNPNGFSGFDGIFRFYDWQVSEREHFAETIYDTDVPMDELSGHVTTYMVLVHTPQAAP